MNTSVIAQPLSPGIISVNMAGQVFTHELRPPPLSPADNARVLDLASPLYNPGATIDGVSKVYDRSGNGNHGTITGATWKRLPSGLSYLDFDGNDLVDLARPASLEFGTGNFTLECWFKIPATASSMMLLDKYIGTGWYFQLLSTSSTVRFLTRDGTHTTNNHIATSGAYDDGLWHYAVAVREGDNILVDVDQSDEATNSPGDTNVTAGVDCTLGASRVPDQHLTGSMALVRMYNIALSSAVRQSHYNQERHLFNV